MGRHRNIIKKFYCPKCSKKTLVRDSNYDSQTQTWSRGWKCNNQPPIRTINVVESEVYYDEAQWDSDKAAVQLAECEAYIKKHPPCDCTIFVPGKDAEIIDYHNILDLLIRPGDAIRHHLFEKNSNVHRKGFEVLHSTDDVDVVRHRDNNGVAVWLYWKCMWDPDRSPKEINWEPLQHQAAAFIEHEGVSTRSIFTRGGRYALWTKPVQGHERSHIFRNVPFCGGLGKRKTAEIISWVEKLEANLRAYEREAAAAVEKWEAWGQQLRRAVSSKSSKVHISGWNARSELVTISIHAQLTQEQVEAIAEILRTKPSS